MDERQAAVVQDGFCRPAQIQRILKRASGHYLADLVGVPVVDDHLGQLREAAR